MYSNSFPQPHFSMFNTDVGMLNKIVHVYAYTDFDHRDACRKAGANDKEWQQEYLGRSKPCMRAQVRCPIRSFSVSGLEGGTPSLQLHSARRFYLVRGFICSRRGIRNV